MHRFTSGFMCLWLVMLCVVKADLIGFDFGSTYMKATLVKPGKPFGIVENTASKRKTETMVTLGEDNRLYGKDSFLEYGKYAKTTFTEIQRLFGQKYSEEQINKFKEERFVFNDIVEDDRGLVGWKVMRAQYGDQEPIEQIFTSEETIAMLFSYVKMLAEKQAGGVVKDCVITVPSWYTYDQRLMLKDAAEQLSNLNVLQLVHENTAAAVMFAIDEKIEQEEKKKVLFYNMGAMDTEVSIVEFSMFNVSEKKSSPMGIVLAETYDKELGARDIDITLANMLADKFNALKERQGKPDVRTNVRAVIRLMKDSVKIKEVLSANKFSSVKVPELLDYVTLQYKLDRTELEANSAEFISRITKPIQDALDVAGLTIQDIDQVEVLGGGVRIPMVADKIQNFIGDLNQSTHLNGDEAMCFGSAFIASNSSSAFKVKQVFLTKNLQHDVFVKIQPLNESDALTEEEQKAEGLEENEIIKYNQEFRLFNTSDYYGKTKGLTLNYNKNMKIELFRKEGEDLVLLDTFTIDNLEKQFSNEIDYQRNQIKRERENKKKEAEKKKKEKAEKEAKKKNSTEDATEEEKPEEKEKEEEPVPAEDEEIIVPRPKAKISIEFSRSGILQITKANIGSMSLNKKQVRKSIQMSEDQIRVAKSRVKWYTQRDQDKIKTDIALNDFESMIYKLKDFFREEDNYPYVEEDVREAYMERLNELEDWLYDDGANQNYTVYNNKAKNLTDDFNKYDTLKKEHQFRSEVLEKTNTALKVYEDKIEEVKVNKTWIKEEELQDVLDKISETREWISNKTAEQDKIKLSDDPVLKAEEVVKKMKVLKKLYNKVANKKKPKVKKEKKEKKEEDNMNKTEGNKTESNEEQEEKTTAEDL